MTPGSERGIEAFSAEVAEILGVEKSAVSPESRLVGDLDFDSLAFAELAILMMDRHGSENFLAALDEVDAADLTVRSVFENYAGASAGMSAGSGD